MNEHAALGCRNKARLSTMSGDGSPIGYHARREQHRNLEPNVLHALAPNRNVPREDIPEHAALGCRTKGR